MPIYEYRCTACRHELEAIQKFTDAALVACPKCGQDTLVKLVSAAGFQLKGSGWYQTDFRGNGGKPAAKPDAEGADKPAEGAKTETAPAAKAEPAAKTDTPSAAPAKPSTPSAST